MLTQARLKELLSYDPETGLFTWETSRGKNSFCSGRVAGGYRKGYVRIKIDGVLHSAHRLAFLYMTGESPPEVDHINHIRNDNRWSNLRVADTHLNLKNKGAYRNNTSGVTGVSWDAGCQKWRAYISVIGKIKHLGCYEKKSDAIAARKVAEKEYHYHRNHGRNCQQPESETTINSNCGAEAGF